MWYKGNGQRERVRGGMEEEGEASNKIVCVLLLNRTTKHSDPSTVIGGVSVDYLLCHRPIKCISY